MACNRQDERRKKWKIKRKGTVRRNRVVNGTSQENKKVEWFARVALLRAGLLINWNENFAR